MEERERRKGSWRKRRGGKGEEERKWEEEKLEERERRKVSGWKRRGGKEVGGKEVEGKA